MDFVRSQWLNVRPGRREFQGKRCLAVFTFLICWVLYETKQIGKFEGNSTAITKVIGRKRFVF